MLALRVAGIVPVFLILCFCLMLPAEAAERSRVLDVPGGKIHVMIDGAKLNLTDDEVLGWVKDCASAITAYYGRFPLSKTTVRIKVTPGRGVGFSTATSDDENNGLLDVRLGQRTTKTDLDDDWILTHDMIHLNFPLVTDNRSWIAEGMATYVEPIARMQAGKLSATRVWGELVRDLPQGLPTRADRGLNFTATWERTYWGGALFFFIADLEIRSRTDNKKGLQDALSAVARAGGHIGSDFTPEKCFAIGDKATGVPVLQELYAEMSSRPVAYNLSAIFQAMGIQRERGQIKLYGDAPLSATRRAITKGEAEPVTMRRQRTKQPDEA